MQNVRGFFLVNSLVQLVPVEVVLFQRLLYLLLAFDIDTVAFCKTYNDLCIKEACK